MSAETLWQYWLAFWPHVTAVLLFIIPLVTSCHAVLYKRDTRASLGWVGLIWLVPAVGTMLYVLFGINRIQRKALLLRGDKVEVEPAPTSSACSERLLTEKLAPDAGHLETLAQLVTQITDKRLLYGNRVQPLIGGDEGYPAMLDAIAGAKRTVSLATYIFGRDRVGLMFVEALQRARERGVEVRVLIDDIGSRYTFPSVVGALRKAGVPVERFMRGLMPVWFPYTNLRCHRKVLVVDGQVGFTGGLNIREGAYTQLKPRDMIQDLHFRITGPVVAHLQQVFADDWAFSHGERLSGDAWFPDIEPDGPVLARGITHGPDEDLGKMRLTLLGALACSRRKVAIMTPYFLPDEALVSALNVAALRGVQVDIILPRKNNLALVKWASTAMLWQVLEHGCNVWLSPPPFDHSKLMLVDGIWTLFGSSNWDPRSLRLNFEFNVECYDRELAARLDEHVQQQLSKSERITLADVDGRVLPVRLRDGVARLMSPYL